MAQKNKPLITVLPLNALPVGEQFSWFFQHGTRQKSCNNAVGEEATML